MLVVIILAKTKTTMLVQNQQPKVSQNEFLNMSKFIVTENFKHHTDNNSSTNYKNEISSVYEEEVSYSNSSKIFVIKENSESILGTIRVLKWDYISMLPIQKMFGINPLMCTNGNSINEIWHIGRFAIKQGVRDINLLKKLMVCAIMPVCMHKDNIAFAECDAKLLRVMSLMGIETKVVGESINYLGSETIPVSMSYDGLINFYQENKHLIGESKAFNELPKVNVLFNDVV